MSKAIAIYAGGITELRQAAVREDGVVFTRWQKRHPRYGYRWSAWCQASNPVNPSADTYQCGFATLRRAEPNDCCINNRALFNGKGEVRARLP